MFVASSPEEHPLLPTVAAPMSYRNTENPEAACAVGFMHHLWPSNLLYVQYWIITWMLNVDLSHDLCVGST